MIMSPRMRWRYTGRVPKLWTDTVAEHRQAVREATLDAAARLVAERGLTSVTMSAIATEAGIGRATLYKYFPDVEAILVAWHERDIVDGAAASRLAGQHDWRSKGENRWRSASRDSLCWPYGLSGAGRHAVVADAGNNRILLWTWSEEIVT